MQSIEKYKWGEAPSIIRSTLKGQASAEWGNIPIVQEHIWADADWVLALMENKNPISFVCIVERFARFDESPIKIAGFKDVITLPEFRSSGLATKLMKLASEFAFQDLKSDCGFLFCADDLIPFYERLHFKPLNCRVVVDQPSGKKDWPSNKMILEGKKKISEPKLVDLCGLPW